MLQSLQIIVILQSAITNKSWFTQIRLSFRVDLQLFFNRIHSRSQTKVLIKVFNEKTLYLINEYVSIFIQINN